MRLVRSGLRTLIDTKANSDTPSLVNAVLNGTTAVAILNNDNPIAYKLNGDSLGAKVLRESVHATASPTSSDNLAAGYEDGHRWYEADAGKVWRKKSESAGSATWESWSKD